MKLGKFLLSLPDRVRVVLLVVVGDRAASQDVRGGAEQKCGGNGPFNKGLSDVAGKS